MLPSEVTLLERTLDVVKVKRRRGERRPHKPARLIADRGYDSNPARALLVKREIEPIIPKRKNNRGATHQDGRKLRRYEGDGRGVGQRASSHLWTGAGASSVLATARIVHLLFAALFAASEHR